MHNKLTQALDAIAALPVPPVAASRYEQTITIVGSRKRGFTHIAAKSTDEGWTTACGKTATKEAWMHFESAKNPTCMKCQQARAGWWQ
jgi:hypothetical protein